MEHQKTSSSSTKPMSKILKFLPKATSSVSFQNPQVYSPSKDTNNKKTSDKTHKSNLGIGFSGPMASIVPSDNRRNPNNHTLVFEPTSPRVSCMGQVKCKHYRKLAAAAAAANAVSKHKHTSSTNKFISQTTSFTPHVKTKTCKNEEDQEKVTAKKKASIRGLFRGGSRRSKTEEKSTTPAALTTLPKAPSLGKMKRFSSGRDAFTNFDWTTQVIPLDSNDHTDCEEEEIKMPSSAPVMERNKLGFCENFVRGVNNLEPRKEINLWKRRTMAQPMPLQVHASD